MPTPYEPVIASADAEAARELILDLLEKFPRGLNAKEIGLQLDYSGYSISYIIRPLTASGKVKKDSAGKNKGMYSLNKKVKPVITPPATTPTAEVKQPQKNPDRYLVAWMIDGKGFGAVFTNEAAAFARADEIAKEVLDTPVFIGKAYKRAYCESTIADY